LSKLNVFALLPNKGYLSLLGGLSLGFVDVKRKSVKGKDEERKKKEEQRKRREKEWKRKDKGKQEERRKGFCSGLRLLFEEMCIADVSLGVSLISHLAKHIRKPFARVLHSSI